MTDTCETVLRDIRQRLEEILCTEGCDSGLIMLSHESPSHYDAEQKCQVYDNEYFSPLGDALMALWKQTAIVLPDHYPCVICGDVKHCDAMMIPSGHRKCEDLVCGQSCADAWLDRVCEQE